MSFDQNAISIRIFDKDINLIAEVDDYTSLIYTRSWHGIDEFEIHVSNKETFDLFAMKNYIMLDFDPERTGIVLYRNDNGDGRNGTGSDDYTIKGYDLRYLLSKRISVPNGKDGYRTWTNINYEDILKDEVRENLVSPTNSHRAIPHLTIAASRQRGAKATFQTRYKNILEDQESLSQVSGLGPKIILDPENKRFIYDVREGVDRTYAADNPNAYIFSVDNDRVDNKEYTHSLVGTANMAFVGGQGDGADRKIELLHDDLSGMDRDEIFVDARDIGEAGNTTSSTDTLSERGEEKLAEVQEANNFEFTASAQAKDEYHSGWDLGDRVTFRDEANGVRQDARITQVVETYEDGNISLEPTFGTVESTIINALNSNSQAAINERAGVSQTFKELYANYAEVGELVAKKADIDALTATNINVKTIQSDLETAQKAILTKAEIQDLQAANAAIENLSAQKADVTALNAATAKITSLEAGKANVVDLNATNAAISKLRTDKANITDLNATNVAVNQLKTDKADITALKATNANIATLQALSATIETLLSNRLFAGQAQIDNLTAEQLSTVSGWITSAMIASLTADKITSGAIDTSKVRIASADGGLTIAGPTLQIADPNHTVRLQLGRDAQGHFTFVLFDETGQGTLIDAAGIHPGAVPDGLIVDKMVAGNANIAGSKLNIDSVVDRLNADGTKTINMAKIYLDVNNGTLSEMLARVENDGGFATVNQTTETADGIRQTITELTDTTDGLQTQIDADGETLTGVVAAQSAFSQTVDGLNASVTRLQGDVNDNAAALKPVTEWMRFDETGMTIGNSDSGRKVKINEQAVEFDNAAGEAIARFAEKAEIHDLEIADGGTFSMGNWAWIPRSNGNLSLKWIGGH